MTHSRFLSVALTGALAVGALGSAGCKSVEVPIPEAAEGAPAPEEPERQPADRDQAAAEVVAEPPARGPATDSVQWPRITGKVVEVDSAAEPTRVRMDKGSSHGVEANDVFNIYRRNRYKGRIRVESVGSNSCVGVIEWLFEDRRIEAGDEGAHQSLFDQGEQLRLQENFVAAIRVYEQIQPGTEHWEISRVEIGVCRYGAGQEGEALAVFEEFLQELEEGHIVADLSPAHLARHEKATITAEYYRALILFERGDHKGVVELLSDFSSRHEAGRYGKTILSILLRSQLELDDLEGGRETIALMTERYPETYHSLESFAAMYQKVKDLRGDQRAWLYLLH
ncbi:MAG: hypothetical protein GY725_03355 [bacterium]|nr:hypothetical protein [bacterium]